MSKRKGPKFQYPMGSVSTGTLRPEDLIPAFVCELERRIAYCSNYSRSHTDWKRHRALVKNVTEALGHPDYLTGSTHHTTTHDLEDLTNTLNQYAGPYFQFGPYYAVLSDYGYWLSEEWRQELEENGGLVVADLSEVKDAIKAAGDYFNGEVAVVSDHGNITLYHRGANGHMREVWSVV